MPLIVKARSCWEDRFRRPGAQELLDAIARPAFPIFDAARSHLVGTLTFTESLGWHGLPWRWAFAYSRGGGEPVAYLVPSPLKPLLCIPVEPAVLAGLSIKRLSRNTREGLALAPVISGRRWGQWELSSKALADELLQLVPARATAIGAA